MFIKNTYFAITLISLSILFPNSKVTFGDIEHLLFNSSIIGERKVEIFRPSDLPINDQTIFIFMQDGQMLFDKSITWNNQDWNIDEIFSQRNNKNNNIVIIAVNSASKSGTGFVDNTNRYGEYFPKQSLKYFKKNIKTFIYKKFIDIEKYDYLKFLINELIPFVETKYNLKLNKNNTGIMGSSMGGLFALNAIIEYPDTFGFAGCFSVHWIGIKPIDYLLLSIRKKVTKDKDLVEGIIKYVDMNIDNLNSHRLYFDFGTKGLDQFYSLPQNDIDKILNDNEINFNTLKFEGHSHEEKYWALRFESALSFLINE